MLLMKNFIVILEDNQTEGEAGVLTLQQAGFNARYASTVPEVISIYQENKVDLVLTEYSVGNIQGLELVNKLTHNLPHLPVAVCSAHNRDKADPLDLAIRGWLAKTANYLQELPSYVQGILDCLTTRQDFKKKKRQRQRHQAQNEMTEWLAHNFKNILSASIGYLNLIDFKNENQDPNKWGQYLDESLKNQEQAITLLDQLAHLTAPESKEPEHLAVAEVVNKAWEAVKARVILNIGQQHPERLPDTKKTLEQLLFLNSILATEPVYMALSDLTSILETLLQNALEAVLDESDPRILVRGEVRAGNLEITVRDNGKGMNGHTSQRAFDPFFSTKGLVGVGLSLSILNSIVMRQEGEVDLKSSLGVGTTFKIKLPSLKGSSQATQGSRLAKIQNLA